jgi:hypothetical protein
MKIVPVTGKLPATRVAVDRFLAAPRLMRLGVTEPDGTPLVHPVWYTWEEDQFLLHIGTTSSKRTAIEAQPTVYFGVFHSRRYRAGYFWCAGQSHGNHRSRSGPVARGYVGSVRSVHRGRGQRDAPLSDGHGRGRRSHSGRAHTALSGDMGIVDPRVGVPLTSPMGQCYQLAARCVDR